MSLRDPPVWGSEALRCFLPAIAELDEQAIVNKTLQSATRFYYLRKTCFRGMLRYNKQGKFNIPFGRCKTYNFKDIKNKAYKDLLKRTEIRCEKFESIFEKYNDRKNFMFLDPPYDSEFTNYGYSKFEKTDHTPLAKLLETRCLMIIGKMPFIENLYQGYIVEEYEKKYGFTIDSGRIGDEINTKHLIIMNYPPETVWEAKLLLSVAWHIDE
eukprot:SAG22_NODE_2_length_61565_cov_858.782010_51_plen_212_part_00